MGPIMLNSSDQSARAAARLRRQQKLDRWRRPLVTKRDRLAAWADMVFVDHGFFRMIYLNLHQITAGAWRSAQPTPYQIRRLARRGLRSVVSLRGGQSFGSLPLEIEACKEMGLNFETFVLRSRDLPTVEEIQGARELFQRLEYPVLFHCKSGADRVGMMSALFLALHEGVPVVEARRQLSLRFGHFCIAKTGVLDALFDAYERDSPAGDMPFMEWVETRYDRDAITAEFKPWRLGNFLTDTLLHRE